jgi:hypothetical protein
MRSGYGFEWTPGLVLLGTVLVLPFVPGLALIALVAAALAAVAAVVGLVGTLLATPYLLVRSIRRRLAERRRPTEGSAAIASGIAQAAGVTNR